MRMKTSYFMLLTLTLVNYGINVMVYFKPGAKTRDPITSSDALEVTTALQETRGS